MVRLLCFCLFVCLLAPIGVAGSAAPVDLRPTFTDGGERRFRVESESVITRAVPALDERISQTTRLTYFLTRQISINADGNPSAKLRFDRIRFKTQAPNLLGELEDVEYDTGLWNPETEQVQGRAILGRGEFVANQYATILDPLIGRAITLELSKLGSIESVRIPPEVGDADLISVEMVRDRFLPLVQICPEREPVEIGSTWKQTSEQDSGLGFDVVSVTSWTLEGAAADRATIEVRNEFSTGEVRRDTGISLRESSGSGTAVWNTTEGVLESLESRQAIRMAGSPPELRGGELELVVRSRVQIDRVEEAWTIEPRPEVPAKEPTPAEEPADA